MSSDSVDSAVRRVAVLARKAGLHAGDWWAEACVVELRGPFLAVAADTVNREARRHGLLPDPETALAIETLVDSHVYAVAQYGHLIDGVAYKEGEEGVERVLSDDRIQRVAEIEANHLRGGVTMLLSAGGRPSA